MQTYSTHKRKKKGNGWMQLFLLAVIILAVVLIIVSVSGGDGDEPSGGTSFSSGSGQQTNAPSGGNDDDPLPGTGSGSASGSGSSSATGSDPGSGSTSGEDEDPVTTPGGEGTGDDPSQGGDIDLPPADPKAATIICIDPGHGYADPGALSDLLQGYYEKDINLLVGLALRDELTAMGFTVVMTREDDIYPDWLAAQRPGMLEKMPGDPRIEIAEDNQSTLFISLHCDSASPRASGVRMYYCKGQHAETPAYAAALSSAVGVSLDETVKVIAMEVEDSYQVNREVSMPSVLVELGFISNETDAADMLTEEWRAAMARGLANGILQYYNEKLA